MGVGRGVLGISLIAIALAPAVAKSDVVISSKPTKNMSCSAGVCVPTAAAAVLNVSDLENMLATGNLTVATGGSEAYNIDVKTPVSWSAANTLSLEATVGIAIDAQINSAGSGGLTLQYPSLTYLTFGQRGRVSFQNLSSPLTISGTQYTLVSSIASLASAIAADPSGSFALADDYDASADGTYSTSPIQTTFTGNLEGLGNTISHLAINHASGGGTLVALLAEAIQGAVIEHLRLAHVAITGEPGSGDTIGALAALSDGVYFFQDTATGTIRLKGSAGSAGGLLAAPANGYINTCFANVTIDARKAGDQSEAGGLVGENGDEIINSFATGSVTIGRTGHAGGLVELNRGLIENSYSTGAVSGGNRALVGGLMGQNVSEYVKYVYSTGAVSGGSSSYVGGFAGENGPRLTDDYWDTTTSGTTQAVGKGFSRGITGLTTEQLQSGLPPGFDPSIWGQDSNINNGFPYLLTNPPPK